jgi:hypothetical protein
MSAPQRTTSELLPPLAQVVDLLIRKGWRSISSRPSAQPRAPCAATTRPRRSSIRSARASGRWALQARYVGWGGLAASFSNPETGKFRRA